MIVRQTSRKNKNYSPGKSIANLPRRQHCIILSCDFRARGFGSTLEHSSQGRFGRDYSASLRTSNHGQQARKGERRIDRCIQSVDQNLQS